MDVSELVVRDGSSYFLLLLILNVAQIVLAAEVAGDNAISYFVSPMTSILISHLILNLRQLNPTPDGSEATDIAMPVSTRLDFTTIYLGNLGEPLDYSSSSDEDSEKHADRGCDVEVFELDETTEPELDGIDIEGDIVLERRQTWDKHVE